MPRNPASGLPTGKRQHHPLTIARGWYRTSASLSTGGGRRDDCSPEPAGGAGSARYCAAFLRVPRGSYNVGFAADVVGDGVAGCTLLTSNDLGPDNRQKKRRIVIVKGIKGETKDASHPTHIYAIVSTRGGVLGVLCASTGPTTTFSAGELTAEPVRLVRAR